MATRAWSIGIVLTSFGFVLAGELSPHEEILEKTLATMDTIVMELTKITDEETANAAKPELKKANGVWKETQAKAKKLPPPEKDEKVRLEKKYKMKFDETVKKLQAQSARVSIVPGGKEALKEIGDVLKKNGKQ